MNNDLTPSDELTDRLRAFGQHPVDSAVQSEHLTAIAGTDWRRSTFRTAFASRAKLGAAVVAGFLLGTTGLATVGALGPLQPIAATAVEAATPLDVPKGAKDKAEKAKEAAAKSKTSPDGFHGTARFTDGCVKAENGEYAINRGLYLKQERAKGAAALAAAKASDCGKPLSSTGKDDTTEDEAAKTPTADATPKAGETPKADAACVPKDTAAESSAKPLCEPKDTDAGDDRKGRQTPSKGQSGSKRPATTPVTPEPAEGHSQAEAPSQS